MTDPRLLDCGSAAEIEANMVRLLALIDAKQVLIDAKLAAAMVSFGTAVNAVAASGTLTIATNPTAADTMTIGTKVYTFVETPAEDGDIAIGLDAAATQANIKAAINGIGEGQVCTAHPDVTCGDFAANAATITARVKGTAGNGIATTEVLTAEGNIFGAATLEGGVDGTVAAKGTILVDVDKIYVATDANTIADANWKYASLS